jgi:hypothetical protein
MGKLEDKQLNELIGSLNTPSILDTITEYGDMDHPSILMRKLMFSGNSLRLMKAFGTFIRRSFKLIRRPYFYCKVYKSRESLILQG